MAEEVNKEYAPLMEYLTEIMHNLQNQSDVLRGKDVQICLSDTEEYTDNNEIATDLGIIRMGKTYLQKLAAQGEDFVAHSIAHELSHMVFDHKYNIDNLSNKEAEIFADNYAHILCHRAGYNINLPFKSEKIDTKENTDEHPADKIRSAVMRRTAAYLTDENAPQTVKPFRMAIPETPLVEVYDDLEAQRTIIFEAGSNSSAAKSHELYTDLYQIDQSNLNPTKSEYQAMQQSEDSAKIQQLLQMEDISGEKDAILQMDFHKVSENMKVLDLYSKVLSTDLIYQSEAMYLKFRDYFAEHCHTNVKDRQAFHEAQIEELDEAALKIVWQKAQDGCSYDFLQEYKAARDAQVVTTEDFIIDRMSPANRLFSSENRQKLNEIYANELHELIENDDNSDDYGRSLMRHLNKINGKIHNADVIPLAKTLKQKLKIQDRNLPILQKFVKDNSFEINQIRAELLISKCMLDEDFAKDTVTYLMSDGKKPFGANEDENVIMSDIHADWAQVTSAKRADMFALLLENVSPDNSAQKLALFMDKTSDKDAAFKPLVEMYLSTYTPEQQPYVAASLLSKKDTQKQYGYEDCFKEILKGSGIQGVRALNQIYNAKLPEEILTIESNMSPLKSKDGLIFANLRKLGVAAQKSGNMELRKIGRQLVIATAKVTPMRRTNIRS